MKEFLFQASTQGAVIALLWFLVARDATKLRDRHGATPDGISPFAWGALCGLTWIALIPYLMRRSRVTQEARPAAPTPERNLRLVWLVLTVVAAAWSVVNAVQDDANNAAQHAILAGVFLVCGLIAWSRDRMLATPHSQPTE